MTRAARAAIGWLCLALAAPVWAEEDGMHRSPHPEHTERIAGVTGFFLAEVVEGESQFGGGLRGAFEHSLIEGWLEIELTAGVAWVGEERVYPLDLVLKKPFHISETVNPYVGVGVGATLIEIPGEPVRADVGITAVVGVYFWFTDHFGLDVEVDYAYLFSYEEIHEIVIATGPVFRF